MAEKDHLTLVPKNLRVIDAPPPPVIKGKPGPVRVPKLNRSLITEVPNLGSKLLTLQGPLFDEFVAAMDASEIESDDPFAFLSQKNDNPK